MSTNGHAVLGMDVGLDGALAFYRVGWCATCRPLTTGSCIAGEAICALLREQAPIKHAYIDHATAMPRQGVASMSSFGPHVRRAADGARRRQHFPHGRHIASVGRKAVARGR
jgi:hypothetical protein